MNKNRHILKTWLIIILSLLIVCFIVALIFLFSQKKLEGQVFDDGKIIIANNVILYNEDSDFNIVEVKDEYIVVDKNIEQYIDNILCASVSNTTPNGLLRWVDSCEKINDTYKINTKPASLTDAILKCNINCSGIINSDNSVTIDSYVSKEQFILPLLQLAYAETSFDSGFDVNIDDVFKANINLCADLNLQIYDKRIELESSIRIISPINFGLEKDNRQVINLLNNEKPIIYIVWVGSVPLVFNISYSLDAVLDTYMYDCAFGIETLIDKRIGFHYSSKDGLNFINEDMTEPLQMYLRHSQEHFGFINKTKIPKFEISIKLYDLVGFAGAISLAIDNTVNLKVANNENEFFTLPFTDENYIGKLSMKIYTPIELKFVNIFQDIDLFGGNFKSLEEEDTIWSDDGFILFELNKECGEVEDLSRIKSVMGKYAWKIKGADQKYRTLETIEIIDETTALWTTYDDGLGTQRQARYKLTHIVDEPENHFISIGCKLIKDVPSSNYYIGFSENPRFIFDYTTDTIEVPNLWFGQVHIFERV